VTIIAIVLIAAVVGQILATSTGRAREASVAVLKEKLARLDAAHRGAEVDQASPPAAVTLPVIAEETAERVDADTLRARWLALFARMKEVNEACRISKGIWEVATGSVLDPEATELDDEAREALVNYQTCVAPTLGEIHALRDVEPDLSVLFDMTVLQEDPNVNEGVSRLNGELRKSFWMGAALSDAVGVIDSFTSLSYMAIHTFNGLMFYSSGVGGANWILLKPAVENSIVDDARWNRLHAVLGIRRSQEHFLEQIQRDTTWIMEAFETWADVPPTFKFSEAPVTYVRTWAYPRLTPALFNHDFDRFNRAMDRLLDLAERPYFEVKGDLAQFCEDFDVEPDIDSLKFTRGNPGWYYVLNLSRHEFEQNARNQASIDVIRFAILLEKYKRDSGNYPESLEVFTEALGGALPVNPLMGDGYVYERDGESFHLGFRQETDPERMSEQGFEAITITWWHDPFAIGTEGDLE
jgi:hypothetical protein